jgi:acetyltransferase-like isoleucine patch superfamily enzyme
MAIILSGATIDRGSVMDAGTIVAGNPTRFIRDRNGSQNYQVVKYS